MSTRLEWQHSKPQCATCNEAGFAISKKSAMAWCIDHATRTGHGDFRMVLPVKVAYKTIVLLQKRRAEQQAAKPRAPCEDPAHESGTVGSPEVRCGWCNQQTRFSPCEWCGACSRTGCPSFGVQRRPATPPIKQEA